MSDNWPQPYEGINGTPREDDLLSLEDAAIPRRDMMIGLARCLSSATLVGNPAPVVRRMIDRMRSPEPGDLVFERTMTRRPGSDNALKGFGILLAKRREWWQTDKEWAAELEQERAEYEKFLAGPYSHPGDGPFDPSTHERLTDTAWYVQYGPGERDICRWTNCEFTVIPTDDSEFTQAFGTRDGNGVTVNRDDLLGSLADSGFTLRRPDSG